MKNFSHVANFTGYMVKVKEILEEHGCPGETVLDMPAGNGKFSDALRQDGFNVTSADINEESANYVYVNMEQPKLPFDDESFDWVICMEGIEHVLSPATLVAELCRITKPGGKVIITTPNVQNFYSRLKFLFTGVLYMFEPETTRHPKGQAIDRGHISPMCFPTLCYLFSENGCSVEQISGDKFKRKLYMPVYAILALISTFNISRRRRNHPSVESYKFMSHREMMFSRSLIACWRKQP